MRAVLATLLLSGCLHRYEPIRSAAKAEKDGESETAERLWAKALNEPLAQVEWRTAHRHLCRLREDRIASASEGQTAADLDPNTIRAWRRDLQACGAEPELQVRLRRLEAERLDRELAAITPDARHGHVFTAHPLVRQTASESPWRTTYADWLSDWRTHLEDLKTDGPVTDALRTQLQIEAGADVSPTGGDPTSAALALHEASFRVVGRGTCAGHIDDQQSTATGAGGEVHVTVELTDCASDEVTKLVDVPYSVQRTRLENVEKTRMEWVPTTYPVTRQVGSPRCYQVDDRYEECFTTYSTEYVTTQTLQSVTYTELAEVPYTATEYRKEQRYVRTTRAKATIRLRTPDREDTLPPQPLQEQIVEASSTRPAWSQIRAQTDRAHQTAMQTARAWRLDHLIANAELSTLSGVEDRLTAARAGRSLSTTERTQIADTLGLPVPALHSDRPDLTALESLGLPPDPASQRASLDTDGVLRFGVPILSLTAGVGTAAGTPLEAHRQPRSAEGTLRYDVNYSLVKRTPIGSFGIHLVGIAAARGGLRTQRAHDYPTLRLGQTENDREPWGAWGLEGALAGLVGVRTPVIGVFGGVMPRATCQRIGHTRIGAVSLPLAARLEVRLVPRMPLLVTAWSDLPAAQPSGLPDTLGAHVMFPVARGIWLVGEHSQETARTQVPGLHDEDWVEAGPQRFSRSWGGIALGF